MKHTRVTILSAVILSLTTLLNVPALAFADDRFATQVKLSEPIPSFGMTVDIDGNTAAVGASGFRFSDFPLPVVCVYTREAANWTKEQCLTEEDEVPNSDDNYGFATEVLAASIRHPMHIVDCALAGADVATIPFKVIQQLVKHPLTDKGLEMFLADWKKTGQKIV